ncbi:cell division topological specificity factor MinE [Rhodoferax sp. 4810]|uniref:Cell division topological specificity factor n=1 Tax=Thiospirillum jenense TaxID=1653858 RepID=A0A839HFD4_9GAMM|nr:cell division topological specificity factor MinE [Thiospirillum jenense]MBB1075422.1 cell division topological specificity factor MinE [Rhodoferax jenense]MBB1126800.1 cell division topological specificity factor MinE [Thiospirillum jenense]
MSSFADYFRNNEAGNTNRNKTSAVIAKERLQILVAYDRMARDRPSYLPSLKQEILDVIRKYVNVDLASVSVRYEQEGNQEILELNIVLPENAGRVLEAALENN